MIKIQPPWIEYYEKIRELFKYDDDIKIVYIDEDKEIQIYVRTGSKADAIDELIGGEHEFGNVTLRVTVIPGNPSTVSHSSNPNQIVAALNGNPIVDDFKVIHGVFPNDMIYVLFRKEVVQYFTDNLGDANGLRSTLYQDLAEEIFPEHDGVFFCTSEKVNPGRW